MRKGVTYIWGQATDPIGVIHRTRYRGEELPGGGMRAWKEESVEVERASDYAKSHAAPLAMKWSHGETIGRIVALERRNDRLYAVAETEELTPDDLQYLADKYGDLRWSTGTYNRRNEPLRITEISLTPDPATIGLWPVNWYRLDNSQGNPPSWVTEALKRAEKTEYRSHGELVIHEKQVTAADDYAELDRYMRTHPGEVFHSGAAGRILAVDGRPVVEERFVRINGERVPIEYSAHPGRILSVR